jgi:hypothetical protein
MMTHRRLAVCLLAAGLLIITGGCVSEVTIITDGTRKPVLNCVLTNDSVQTLRLTWSLNIDDRPLVIPIDTATINLYKEDSLVGSFQPAGDGDWTLTYLPQYGATYHLQAVLSDGTHLTASTTMPALPAIEDVPEADAYPTKWFVQNAAPDPCWVAIIAAPTHLFPWSKPVSSDNLHEEVGTDHPQADHFNAFGNLLDLLPLAWTPSFLFYIRLQANESISPLATQPFCLQTNFADHTYVCFQAASTEYDAYLKTSLQKTMNRLDPDDPIVWLDESNVYSNISQGLGIFAAYAERIIRYNDEAHE